MGEWLCLKLDFSVLVWSLLKELGQLSALRRVRSEKGKYRRSPVLSDVVNYQIGFRLLRLFLLDPAAHGCSDRPRNCGSKECAARAADKLGLPVHVCLDAYALNPVHTEVVLYAPSVNLDAVVKIVHLRECPLWDRKPGRAGDGYKHPDPRPLGLGPDFWIQLWLK